METIKELLSFCNCAVFYDYKNLGITDEFNQPRRCITKNFHETMPERLLITLSKLDVVISKVFNSDADEVIHNIHDLRSNIIYMI